MSIEETLLVNHNRFVPAAAHFGVSTEHLVQSSFEAGMVATEVIHSGLTIVPPSYRSHWIGGKALFKSAITISRGADSEEESDDFESISFRVPEPVEEFCKNRGLAVNTVVNVGVVLLQEASRLGVRPNQSFEVYRGRTEQKKGTLDSFLGFTVTPMNMISTTREPAKNWQKVFYVATRR